MADPLMQAMQMLASHYRDDTKDLLRPMPSHSQLQPQQWDLHADGSQKGNGFLGVLGRPDGGVSSEISVSTNDFGGREFPMIVPTLTPGELQFLLNMNVGRDQVPISILRKAVAFAHQRQAQGKPLFAQSGDERPDLFPQFRRKQ